MVVSTNSFIQQGNSLPENVLEGMVERDACGLMALFWEKLKGKYLCQKAEVAGMESVCTVRICFASIVYIMPQQSLKLCCKLLCQAQKKLPISIPISRYN